MMMLTIMMRMRENVKSILNLKKSFFTSHLGLILKLELTLILGVHT